MLADGQKLLLLVEDEAIIAMAEKNTLEKYGYGVRIVFTGEAAVAAAAAGPDIDLVLMDINLGSGLDGTEAAALILKDRDLPIVFLSSHIEPKIVAKTEKITSYGYVVKDSSGTVLDASIKMAFKLFDAKIGEKEKEDALREGEERYRAIFDHSPDAILLTAPDGAILAVNASAERLFGRSAEELARIGRAGILDPSDPRLAAALEERARTGRFFGELTFVRKDGSKFPAESSSIVFHDREGRARTSMVIRDITERKRAEEELRKRNRYIESILDNMPIGFAANTIDDGAVRYMNDLFTEIYGWPRDILTDVNHFFANVYPGPEGDALKTRVLDDMRSGDPGRMAWDDLQITTRAGERRFISARNIPILEQNLMVSTVWDTTRIHESQEALKAGERVFRSLFENMLNGSFYGRMVHDPEGRPVDFVFVSINKAFTSMTGFADVTGKTTSEILPGFTQSEPWILEYLERVAGGGQPENLEVYIRMLNMWVAASVYCPERGSFVAVFDNITERRKAEDALREAEARFRLLFEQSSDGIVILDPDTMRFLEFNETAHRQLGYSREEFARLAIPDIEAVETAGETRDTVAAVMRDGLREFETRHRAKGGETRNVLVRARYTALGDRAIYHCVWRDITERKRAVEALQASEERLQDILFSMADWVWEVNAAGVYTYSSAKADALFGRSGKEIIGKTPFDLMLPKEAERIRPIFGEIVARKGVIKDLENWNIGRDGRIICLLTNGVPILDEKGNLKGYRGVDKDITDRKRAEVALRESETRAQALLRTIPDLLFRVDRRGVFLDFRAEAHELYTAPGISIIGANFRDVLPADIVALIDRNLQATLKTGALQTFEYQLEVPGRGKRDYEARMAASGPDEVTAIIRDITESRRAEEKIQRQLIEKEILLKEVHHRIKNNFASMSALLSLQAHEQADPKVAAALQEAKGRVDSMRILYDKLLLSEGYRDIAAKSYVESLVTTVISLNPSPAKVKVDLRIDDISLNQKKVFPLGIIINELLTNVMKYAFTGRTHGTVLLELKQADGWVTLILKDNGVGLPAGFRIEESKGFGFMLVKMLSEQMDGTFALEGGKGTRATLVFKA